MKIDRRSLLVSGASLATGVTIASRSQAVLADVPIAKQSRGPSVKQRYVRVNRQNVFYLTAGSGPPVVMLHPSPGDSSYFMRDLPELARHYAVFAFDSPGFGRSDPSGPASRDVSDMADTIAAAMRALNLPPASIYGAHTGAAVASELASRNPDVVATVIQDGLAVFNNEEAGWFADFFPPMVPDKQGSHFTSVWTRCRDQSVWFPWSLKKPEHLLQQGVAPASRTQVFMMGMMRCGRTYAPSFKSVVFYAPRVPGALAKIEQPMLITCARLDPLASHLERLPSLKPTQVVKPAADAAAVRALRDEWLAVHAGRRPAPSIANTPSSEAGVSCHVAEIASGAQIFMRVAGDPNLPPLIFLPDAPGSTLMHLPLIVALSKRARVYAIDLPGCGETAPFQDATPTCGDFAQTVIATMAALGLKQAIVHGIGFGSAIALEVAVQSPKSVVRLVMRSLPLPTQEERKDLARNYAPRIELKANGSHWYDTFLMLRDSLTFWPWYKNTTSATQRHVNVSDAFDADHLHDWTVEVMKQHAGYHQVIEAVWMQNTRQQLTALASKALLCSASNHPFIGYDQVAQDIRPDLPRVAAAQDDETYASQIAHALAV